jgi:NAD(P)-dependent dehydrogenase (short-subunit alcohol dehydrogenase family)
MKLRPGHKAVVTGGASGIGFALAHELCSLGLGVALVDIEEGALNSACKTLLDEGFEAHPYRCDVSDPRSFAVAATAIKRQSERVDLLINNAGVGGMLGPLWDSSPNEWTWAFGVNVHGVVNGIREFLPGMIAQGAGHVVNIASLAGLTSPPFLATYVASKHAVVGLSESLAAELGAMRSPVKVSVVCPGRVESNILTSFRNRPSSLPIESGASPELVERLRLAMETVMGEPMPSRQLARLIIDAVERDELLVLTHPRDNGPVRQRLETIECSMKAVERTET